MNVNRQLPQSVFNTQSQGLLEFLEGRALASPTDYLHRHQIDAVLCAKQQLQDPSQPNIALVVLPTGCGKTGVAVLAPYALNATRVLVVTPSVKISKQIHEAFCGSKERECFLLERKIIRPEQIFTVCPSGVCIEHSVKIRQHMQDHVMVVNAHKVGGQSSVAIDEIPSDNYDLVIVDEAHHYPAPTWKLLVDHFPHSNRLFLTATPSHDGKPILPYLAPCYELSRHEAVDRGVIRDLDFVNVPTQHKGDRENMEEVAKCIKWFLDQHDGHDPSTRHQAMVLTQTIKLLNPAAQFKAAYDAVNQGDICETYTSQSQRIILDRFDRGEIRTLVIVGKLLEGYDNKRISVVGIVRNVARQSKVLFSQFVGRAVRKAHPQDPVTTVIVSHPQYNQSVNFDQFDKVTDEDNVDDE